MAIATAADDESAINTEAVTRWLESNLGPVKDITLLPRWRPMWYAELERDGATLPICVRGDRIDTESIFPLHHEMTAQALMHDNGIKVARVYGWIDEANAYVMDRIEGDHNLDGLDEAGRDEVVREYMRELAHIHQIPLDRVREAGISGASGGGDDVEFILKHWRDNWNRQKKHADPFLEFVWRFLDRKKIASSDRQSLIVWDASQFMQHQGSFKAVIDLEVAHVGDPMWDLAMVRHRDGAYFPLTDIAKMYRWYSEASGTPIDRDAIQLYQIFISVTSALSFHTSLWDPTPETDYEIDLYLSYRGCTTAVELIASYLGVDLPTVELPEPEHTPWEIPFAHTLRTMKSLESGDQYTDYRISQMAAVTEYLARSDKYGRAVLEANLDDIEALLGTRPRDWDEGDTMLEKFVLEDDGTHDEALLQLFNKRTNRFRLLLAPADDYRIAKRVFQPLP